MRSVLMLLAMSFLLLPILPNHPVDPWDIINPAQIWLLAILIAAVSFAGYVAVRILGDRAGIMIAAIAGGLASSTATTMSFSRLAREHPQSVRLLAGGVLLAGVIMLMRIIILAGFLKPELLWPVAWPAGAGALVLLLGSAVLLGLRTNTSDERPSLAIRNPFELGTVLQLAALIAVIVLLAKLAAGKIGNTGVYLLAALSGVVDVDALTLSMTRLAGAQVTIAEAATAILIAASINTVSKATMAAFVGGRAFGLLIGGVSALAIIGMGSAATLLR
jgi:uncharacterized membrane protein (DUF4010 family)